MAKRLSVCLLVLMLAGAAHAAQTQWLPGESWPGGKQYDSRLDQPVHLWVTAMPLAQVFAALTKQTGVALGFFPPGDDNERLCVNLYLNPKQPPTLRDLLAQLSWTVDCSFSTTGDGDQRQYFLLRTSAGSGALAEWEKWRDQASDARQQEQDRLERDLWQKALARRPELKEALELSREEAIEKYSGDPMLLTLLDPQRRAVARFMLSLPEADLARLGPNRGERIGWGLLTPEQQGWLKEAIQPLLDAYAAQQARTPRPGFPWHDWSEATRLGVDVTYWAGATDLWIQFEPAHSWQEAQAEAPEVFETSTAILVADPREQGGLHLLDAAALRRLLGEADSDEQAEELGQQAFLQRERENIHQAMNEQLTQYRRVSAEAMARLSAATLPVDPNQPYALWQLQEAVAAQSGFSVVSDCTWQPARSSTLARQLLFAGTVDQANAFLTLTAACVTNADPIGNWVGDSERAAWEWGDAGNILRFRSTDRALWREAMLPPAALKAMDRWMESHLPDLSQVGEEPPAVTVPLEVRAYAPLVASLTVAQLVLGAGLTYGDPTDLRTAYRQALSQELLGSGPGLWMASRIISSLDNSRWQQLQGEGLVWGKDIRVDPTPVGHDIYWTAYREGDVLHYEEGAAPDGHRRGLFYASREGRDAPRRHPGIEEQVPIEARLRPSLPKHLVSPPE